MEWPAASIVRRTAVAVLLSILATGCTQLDVDLAADGQTSGLPSRATSPIDQNASPDDTVDAAIADIVNYWRRVYPEVYETDFVEIDGGFHAYGPDDDAPPCDDEVLEYAVIEANAFYCPEDDYVAWDRVALIPALQDDFGPFTVAIVFAHEIGHAIQSRAEVRGRTVNLELQADCFAGAWAADVAAGDDRAFTITGHDLDRAIAGFLELRDNVGIGSRNPNAHGSGFDRINAFQDGLDRGPGQCATYARNPPEVFATAFLRQADFERGGNLPTDLLVEPLLGDIDKFFIDNFAEAGLRWDPVDQLIFFDSAESTPCGDLDLETPALSFYCVPDDLIYIDRVVLLADLEAIGDFAVAGEIVRQYAIAAQHRLGIAGVSAAPLHADCVVGAYTGEQFAETIPDQTLTLSPGDIDEVLIAFLANPAGDETVGAVFDRTASFRGGFVNGFASCEALL